MRVRFLDAAQRELDDAAAWYNQREAGLGWEFLDELDRSVRMLQLLKLADHLIRCGASPHELPPYRQQEEGCLGGTANGFSEHQ
jgi:hypothetical protein